LKFATYIGGTLGIALLVALVIRADLPAIATTLTTAGWPLLWLVPYRALFYLSYAVGWLVLLSPEDPVRRVRLGYAFWVTSIREAIDRLLPVASIGGGVVGVRLLRWRGLGTTPVAASIIVETILTLVASYVFTAVGLLLLIELCSGEQYRRLTLFFLLSIPVPVATLLLLRYGSVFARLQKLFAPWVGVAVPAEGAASLDRALGAMLDRRRRLAAVLGMQIAALFSGAFEVWFALHLFGHPVNAATALVLESMTLAVRHVAFVVPAGIGVQEAGLVVFGHALGIDGELALAVSMAKRLREIAWGIPALVSWQWAEGRRLQAAARVHSYD
jgi:putative membrane protein